MEAHTVKGSRRQMANTHSHEAEGDPRDPEMVMKNLCDTCRKADYCQVNTLRLKFRDDLRIMQSEASINDLKVIFRIAVDECVQYEGKEGSEIPL